jgi:hypothetical protein
VAEELLVHVPAELVDKDGDVGPHGCGGSGAGGSMPLSDPSDQTGDIVDVGEENGYVLRCGRCGRGGCQPIEEISEGVRARRNYIPEGFLKENPANASSIGSCRSSSLAMRRRFWRIFPASTSLLSKLNTST